MKKKSKTRKMSWKVLCSRVSFLGWGFEEENIVSRYDNGLVIMKVETEVGDIFVIVVKPKGKQVYMTCSQGFASLEDAEKEIQFLKSVK
jgi:hypothetical protein